MQKFFDCGIDLGTTNSCVAIPDDNHGFEIIENQQDRMSVTPSAISINSKGRMSSGARAINTMQSGDLAVQFKRQMGTNKKIHFQSYNVDKSPEELSAEILKRLRSDVTNRLNVPIENVVITVPAAFRTLQSEATNRAGRMAGFKNIILLQEPIAAAVAYGAKPDAKDKYWMVFDYGGGTLDVAIVSTMDNRLTVKNSEGNNYFGGSDIDMLIYQEIVLPKLKKEYAVNKLLDESSSEAADIIRKMVKICEDCKIQLSNSESTDFMIDFDLDDDEGNPIDFECIIERSEFEALIKDTVAQSIEIAKQALNGADITAEQLDKILLVGGSTFIPLVRSSLTEAFGKELDSSINPMTVVAAGAAIYASTSYVDSDEEPVAVNSEKVVLNITYDPIVSTQTVNIIGRIAGAEQASVDKVKVDCAQSADFSGVIWSSGWVELLDKTEGIFDIDLLLQLDTLNHFKVSVCDSTGSEIEVENPMFAIKHNANVLKTSAPPATASIGVLVVDKNTGYSRLEQLIKKNTPLPAEAMQVFKTNKDLNPGGEDMITIQIWEGENVINPTANFPAGEVQLKSSQMRCKIEAGTEIEITIKEDADRNIQVSGYIPDLDYEIPEQTMRPEATFNMQERLEELGDKMKQMDASIEYLDYQEEDTDSLKSDLAEIKNAYNSIFDKLNSDEAKVNQFIENYYATETRIINHERAVRLEIKNNRMEICRHRIEHYGNDNEIREFKALEIQYNSSSSDEEKKFLMDRITDISFNIFMNSRELLADFYYDRFANSGVSYTNDPQAVYWKGLAETAISSGDIRQLREAVFKLMDLQEKSVDSAIGDLNADLRV